MSVHHADSSPGNLFLRLSEKGRLLLDGATGYNYFELGLEAGAAPEYWNLEKSHLVQGLHQAFIEAGADVLWTNSFGGNRERLKLHGLADKVAEVNALAVAHAHSAIATTSKNVLVAGSVGPTGSLLEPNGPLSEASAITCFAEQIRALIDAGADVIALETLSSFEEARAAIVACREHNAPYILTMSFDSPHNRTMMGISPDALVDFITTVENKPFALGANCGIGPRENLVTLLQLTQSLSRHPTATVRDIKVIGKPNRGIPKYADGKVTYEGNDQTLEHYVTLAYGLGVSLIGGCCGTTPANLATMRQALDNCLAKDKTAPTTMTSIIASFGETQAPLPKYSGRSERRRRRK